MRLERLDSLARQIQDMYKPIVRAQRLRRYCQQTSLRD